MTTYAIKAAEEKSDVDMVFNSLKGGEGRFGWSYVKTADLSELRERIKHSGWDSLTQEEQDCYNGQDFLLHLKDGDYVVYINVPEGGQCTLAKVTGEYEWRYEDHDFNHRFPVDPASIRTFVRNQDIVPAALRARLKLPGRKWTIYVEREFEMLLESLRKGIVSKTSTPESNLAELLQEIRPQYSEITKKIHHTHPGKDLETFVERVFAKVPGVKKVTRQEGRDDRGADLLVELEFGEIPGLVQTLVVQVKSWTGEMAADSAVRDIERAFDYYSDAKMGLIVSTAESASEAFHQEMERLQEEKEKPVSLLIGDDLAAFFLRYGGDLLY